MFRLCYRFCRAQVREKKIARFYGSGAVLLNAAMTTEQAHQRLGLAQGVIHKLQEQLQRVTARHQAAHEALQSIHQEMSILRSQIDTRSRVRLVAPKSLMPDRFGMKNGPSWRTWSYLARDFVGVVHTALKQATQNAGNRQQPIAATNLQHDFGVTNEMDQQLHHVLISRSEGEALEVVRGAEQEQGLEQWRRLAALCDPLAAGRSLDDSKQILSPPKAAQIDDFSHAIQAWENLEQRHRERTEDQEPKGIRHAMVLSMCPTDLERELTAQQRLFPDYAQMRAHIVTVINSRTRCPGEILNDEASHCDARSGEFVESEDGKLYRLEIRNDKKVFTKLRHDLSKGNTKGGGKGRTDKECFRCGRIGHLRADCRATTHINGGQPKSAPKGKGVGTCEEEDPECHRGSSIWGPLRCCQTTVTPKMMVMLMNSEKKPQELCHRRHLPLGSIRQRLQSMMKCIAGSFGNLAMETAETKSLHSSIVGKHEQSDVVQQVNPWARNAPKSVPSVKSCLSVNFHVCSVCQKLGVYQHLRSRVPQYDISSEGEGRSDEIPVEAAPSDPSARACCLVRGTAYLWDKILRITLKARRAQRYSQEWNRGERSTNSGCYSAEPASGNRGYGTENS